MYSLQEHRDYRAPCYKCGADTHAEDLNLYGGRCADCARRERDIERAMNCQCGALQYDEQVGLYHVADCICGSF